MAGAAGVSNDHRNQQVLERNIAADLTDNKPGKIQTSPRNNDGSAPESRFLYPRRVEPRRARPLPTIGRHADGLEHTMKIALLVLLGLVVGALGGAALGIGAGLAWTQIFRTTAGFEGYNGMLVFFTFMPLGAAIGGLGGAFLFGVIAIRDAEIALEQKPAHRRDR